MAEDRVETVTSTPLSTPLHPVAGMDEAPPYLFAGLTALGVLILYVVTLAPTTQFWDTSEYISAARVLGIPHPPGNPLFVILAHAWGLLPLAKGYAERVNLFAAVTSAIAAGCWFLISERWLRPVVPLVWPRRLAALASTIACATAFTVWNQSVVNEKVYTVSLASIALVLWFVVRWGDQRTADRRDHYLLLIVYLLALTATNHLMGLLAAPAVLAYLITEEPVQEHLIRLIVTGFVLLGAYLVFLAFSDPHGAAIRVGALVILALAAWAAQRTRHLLFAGLVLGVAIIGVSVWAFLPIRAHFYPAINEGEPTTWEALKAVLNREQYGKPPVTERQATFIAQIGMWVQYFSWQWGRDFTPGIQSGLAVIFGGIGLLGAWRHWKADRRSALAMTALMFTLTLILIFYLNFKYGFSEYPDRPQLAREVRERDYFYIASYALWGIWVGLGLATFMEWVEEALRPRVPALERRWWLATPVLVISLVPLLGNYLTASRAGETLARDFAYDMLQSVEPYGVLITAGDNDTFPLWYGQEVEGIRKDVVVLNLSLGNTDWYLRQMQRRPVFPFDSANAPAIYRGRAWFKPTGPVLSFSDQQLASLQPYYVLENKTSVKLGTITTTLDPQVLGRPYLERADIVVLQAIKDQQGRRPIYFSRTVGGYADQLGLGDYLEGQGFARKLHYQTVEPSDSIAPVGQLGFFNLPRTEALLFGVYHGHAAARVRPRGWLDRPSEGIPALYGLIYQALGEAVKTRNPQLSARSMALADSIFRQTSYGALANR